MIAQTLVRRTWWDFNLTAMADGERARAFPNTVFQRWNMQHRGCNFQIRKVGFNLTLLSATLIMTDNVSHAVDCFQWHMIRLKCSCHKWCQRMTTFVWFCQTQLQSVQDYEGSTRGVTTKGTEEVRRQKHQRGAKPDQFGATSRMWINGARPQAGEQPLASVDMTLQ